MVEKSTFTQPKFIDNGSVDWEPVKTAFSEIQEILNEHADEVKSVVRHNTQTISYAIDGAGSEMVIQPSKHLRGKITNAFLTLGDNIEQTTSVELRGISSPLNINSTEGAGKVRLFKITKPQLHFIDGVEVIQTGTRRMVITITIESIEEN